VNKQMFSKKLLVALLTIAIVGTAAIVLGCTSPTPAPTAVPTSNPSPTATPNPLSGHILVAGSSSVGPHVDRGTNLSNAFAAACPNVQVDVSISDSGTGIKSVEAGTSDIGMSSRALTATDGADLVGTVIAFDGIAIIVAPGNKVTDLTKQQITDIFSGKIRNWNEVGGNDAGITVFQREASSGTRSAFNSLVMGTTNVTSDALQASNTLNMIQSVKGNPNAIGYCSFGEMSSDVKALQVGGVIITPATIKDKTYAIQRPFLLVTKGPAAGPAKAYIDFVLSPQGQDILAQDNLVKV
jgi:phosphate transport system substrate-binding protein